jgi:hypothetical protein
VVETSALSVTVTANLQTEERVELLRILPAKLIRSLTSKRKSTTRA